MLKNWITNALAGTWVWYVVAAIVVGCLGFAGVQSYRLNTAKADTKTAQAELHVSKANEVQLGGAIDNQNAAISGNADASKKAQASADKRAQIVLGRPIVPSSPGADSMNLWLERNK